MNLNKMASKDAARWAYAEMFFGEGAGTRRKLLNAEIAQKMVAIPGYQETFESAMAKQDMAQHAFKAAKERKAIDRSAAVKRNVRGILTGNTRGLTNTVLTGLTIYAILHQTGLDEPIKQEIKARYHKVRLWAAVKRDEMKKDS
jgi:hypothetical protein